MPSRLHDAVYDAVLKEYYDWRKSCAGVGDLASMVDARLGVVALRTGFPRPSRDEVCTALKSSLDDPDFCLNWSYLLTEVMEARKWRTTK